MAIFTWIEVLFVAWNYWEGADYACIYLEQIMLTDQLY